MSKKTYLVLTREALWKYALWELVQSPEKTTLIKLFNLSVSDDSEIIEGKSIGLLSNERFNKIKLFGKEPDKALITLDVLMIGDCDNQITRAFESAKKTGEAIERYL